MWSFLDTINYNVLLKYEYNFASGRLNKAIHAFNTPTFETSTEAENYALDERNNILYTIWFVYYHVLECKTLNDVSELDNLSIFKDFGLLRYIDRPPSERAKLYIGYGEQKYYFTTPKDIDTILEILYNRYNYKEQLDCVARHLTLWEQRFKLSPKKSGKESLGIRTRKATINNMIKVYKKWEKAS